MAHEAGLGVLQPDPYYVGGLIRTLRVAQIAAEKGIPVAPHGPGDGDSHAPVRHVAAVIPNLWPFLEVSVKADVRRGKVDVPSGPGLGIVLDSLPAVARRGLRRLAGKEVR